MLTFGQTRRDASRPYLTLAGASYDVVGFRSFMSADVAADRCAARFGCEFQAVELGGRFYAVEVVAKYSSVYREMVHRVKGTTRWAMVRPGAIDLRFEREYRIGARHV